MARRIDVALGRDQCSSQPLRLRLASSVVSALLPIPTRGVSTNITRKMCDRSPCKGGLKSPTSRCQELFSWMPYSLLPGKQQQASTSACWLAVCSGRAGAPVAKPSPAVATLPHHPPTVRKCFGGLPRGVENVGSQSHYAFMGD